MARFHRSDDTERDKAIVPVHSPEKTPDHLDIPWFLRRDPEEARKEMEGSDVDPALDVAKYEQGKCHLFALALHRVTGYPIKALWDLEPSYDDVDEGPPALVHMYVTSEKGLDVDAGGVMHDGSAYLHANEVHEATEVRHSAVEVERLIENDVLCEPDPGEMSQLISFIQANLGRYTTDAYADTLRTAPGPR